LTSRFAQSPTPALHLVRQEASLINLELLPEFEPLFVESLYLRQMQSN
jgi:hypothetical protein